MTNTGAGQCGLSKNESQNQLGLKNTYGGIPQNLIFNTVLLAILMTAFLILRRSAYKVLNKLVRAGELDKKTSMFLSLSASMATGVVSGVVQGAKGVTHRVVRGGGTVNGSGQVIVQEPAANLAVDDAEDQQRDNIDDIRVAEGDDPGGGDIGREEAAVERVIVDGGDADADAGGEANGVARADGPVIVDDADAGSTSARRQRLQRTHTLTHAPSYREWLGNIFLMKDAELLARCGEDALQYLRYQRYVIFYLTLVMVLCICVILPLNFQGTLQGDHTSFEHTTMVNLDPESDYLWAHVTFAFLFFPIAIVIMRWFSRGVRFQDVDMDLRKTLLIEKIPKYLCREEDLKAYFEEAFENKVKIRSIYFAYNVEDLMEVENELRKATLANQYMEIYDEANSGKPLMLYPKACSRCSSCFCCCCSNKVNASEYYCDLVDSLKEELERERREALGTPLGIAFVTFSSINNSKLVYDEFQRPSIFDFKFKPPLSSNAEELKVEDWKVSFAPPPDDLYWEHLSLESRFLLLKKIVINTGLFFVAFFLTTPEYLISQTDFLVQELGSTLHLSSVIVDFLPTLMLWGFTALLPLLVAWSDRFLGHWTRSNENHNIMKKTFWFLLFMVVILPTFGFTTADAIFRTLFNDGGENSTDVIHWECIFLPDSGAFFVNYIATAAIAGAGLELLRFPELFFYAVKTCLSKSKADTPAIRDAIKYEFRFGEHYARMALIFCMTMIYCLSCPLITPFGWLFFVTKHYVDRHNILYAYKPSKINKRVHGTAINFVILGVVIMQFFMLIYTFLRSGQKEITTMTKVMGVIFLVSINIFSAQLWAETCKKFSPIVYEEVTVIRDDVDLNEYVYLPDVLKGTEAMAVAAAAGASADDTAETGRDDDDDVGEEGNEGSDYGTFPN